MRRSGSLTARLRQVIFERPYTALASLALMGLGAEALLRHPEDWQTVYLPVGRWLVEGRDIHDLKLTGFPYPPLAAFLGALFAGLPAKLGRVLWSLLNCAAIAAFWWCAWRAAGGPRRLRWPSRRQGDGAPDAASTDWREHAALWLGMAVGFRFVTDVLEHQQTDVLIAALTAGAALAVVRERWLAAAALCGAGAAIKATPAIWAGYFLIRRRWLAAVLMVVVAGGVSLLPDGVSRPPTGGVWLARWAEGVLRPIVVGQMAMGKWLTAPIYNQSLAGTLYRLLTIRWPAAGGYTGVLEVAPRLSAPAIRWLIHLAQAGLLILAAAAIARGGRGTAPAGPERPHEGAGVPRAAIECAVVIMLMVLLPPASSKPHCLVVLLPAYCLARLALTEGDRVAGTFLAAALACSVGSNRSLLGRAIGQPAQWAGGITGCGLALFLGCAAALLRRARRGPDGSA